MTLRQSATPVSTIYGNGGSSLTGLSSATELYNSGSVGELLTAGSGDTTFGVSNPNDVVVGGAGVDTIIAYTDFALPNNVENLQLNGQYGSVVGTGNALANIIIADRANETIIGKGGDDVLVSAHGGDTFEFASGSGRDVIQNFATGANGDVVRLEDYGFSTFGQVKAALHQVGSDAVLTLSPTDLIDFKNTNVSAFTSDNFHLQIDTSVLKETFDDEFNSLSLYDAATGQGVWKTNYAWGNQNGLDSRMASSTDAQVFVDPSFAGSSGHALGINPFSDVNGVVSLSANKATAAQSAALGGYQYTAGLLSTEKSFAQTYGYFEVRAEVPVEKGLWPAFWFLPKDGSYSGELDAFESVDDAKDTIHSTVHDNVTNTSTSLAVHVEGLSQGFHTYGLLWTPQTVTFYVDGSETGQIATPADLHSPMYLVLSMGVGAASSWPGAPDSSTAFPASLNVDYVHAYAIPGVSTDAAGHLITDSTAAVTANPVAVAPSAQSAGANAAAPTYTLVGTDATEVLNGTSGNDVILTGTGADTVLAGSGDDTITGNTQATADSLQLLFGNKGRDVLSYSAGGSVEEFGGQDNDTLSITSGGQGRTHYEFGNLGDDTMSATGGYNSLYGGQGADSISVASDTTGHNYVSGDLGDDTLVASQGGMDTLHGGQGADTITLTSHSATAGDMVTVGAGESTSNGDETNVQHVFGFTSGSDHVVLAGHATLSVGAGGNLATYADATARGSEAAAFQAAYLYAYGDGTAANAAHVGASEYLAVQETYGGTTATYLFTADHHAVALMGLAGLQGGDVLAG